MLPCELGETTEAIFNDPAFNRSVETIPINFQSISALLGSNQLNDDLINSYCGLIRKTGDPSTLMIGTFFYEKLQQSQYHGKRMNPQTLNGFVRFIRPNSFHRN